MSIERLIEAAAKTDAWVKHEIMCQRYLGSSVCTCGLEDHLRELHAAGALARAEHERLKRVEAAAKVVALKRHFHKSMPNSEDCLACGKNFRDDVHFRDLQESFKSDVDRLRDALEAANE